MKSIFVITIFASIVSLVCAETPKEDEISMAELKAAGEWNLFTAPEPPLTLPQALSFARAYLVKKEKFGEGDWILVDIVSPEKNLIQVEPTLWFWRLNFIFSPSGAWSGPMPSRSVAVLMNGKCLSPHFKIKKTEPSQPLQTMTATYL